jgi:hypothetical protein
MTIAMTDSGDLDLALISLMMPKLCNPPKHVAVAEVLVFSKGKPIFKKYITKKHKQFGTKTYEL